MFIRQHVGLKQAPRAWFDIFSQALTQLGFTHAKYDESLFFLVYEAYIIYVIMYENDMTIIGSNSTEVNDFI